MIFLVWLFALPAAAAQVDLSPVASELRQLLEQNTSTFESALDGTPVPLHPRVEEFYRMRHYFPAWLEGRQLNGQARRLLSLLRAASNEGLDPEDYQVSTLTVLGALNQVLPSYGYLWDLRCLARLDILLTNACLKYADHLVRGRATPSSVYPGEWHAVLKSLDVVELLRDGLRQGKPAGLLMEAAPKNPHYIQLRKSLDLYRKMAQAGGWPQIPEGKTVKRGENDWRIPWVRRHLVQVGDLPVGENQDSPVLEEETALALQRFQGRHGLKADGVFGPDTLAELNVSVEERIRQIELNLERARWLPDEFGDRHLLVNIADFRLFVIEGDRQVLEMAVVVGMTKRRTPVFSSRLSYLVFAPYWNVPLSILRREKLPRIKADIEYLAAYHYQIVSWKDFPTRVIDPSTLDWELINADNFPGMLRQKPGPWNSLGRVKFMLPNSFDVYLHDTPEQNLFKREERVFSSGCIRLERPAELAAYLLREQRGWNEERILKAMAAERPQRVDIPDRLPVHILYQTAWVDSRGDVQFRKDIYKRDQELLLVLNKMPSQTRALLASEVRHIDNENHLP
ncbi:MAG: L,D-transpeptidase family protein [Syntrophotaleaceae bacterium]